MKYVVFWWTWAEGLCIYGYYDTIAEAEAAARPLPGGDWCIA